MERQRRRISFTRSRERQFKPCQAGTAHIHTRKCHRTPHARHAKSMSMKRVTEVSSYSVARGGALAEGHSGCLLLPPRPRRRVSTSLSFCRRVREARASQRQSVTHACTQTLRPSDVAKRGVLPSIKIANLVASAVDTSRDTNFGARGRIRCRNPSFSKCHLFPVTQFLSYFSVNLSVYFARSRV